MKKVARFRWIISILSFGLLACSAILLSQILSRPLSSQSDYPVLPQIAAMFSSRKIIDLKDLIHSADLVVVGTVIEVQPAEDVVYIPVSGSPEAMIQDKIESQAGQKVTSAPVTRFPVKIRIEDILKGSSDTTEVVLIRSSFTMDATPVLTENMRMIFFLNKQVTLETYVTTSLGESYFYISEDQRVYPAALTDAVESTSGMKLDTFKHKINDLS